jgi:hypothetical protein
MNFLSETLESILDNQRKKKNKKGDKKFPLQTENNIASKLEQRQEKQENKISIGFDIDEVISNYPYGFQSKYSIIPPTKAIKIIKKCSLGKKIINKI